MPQNRPSSGQSRTAWGDEAIDAYGADGIRDDPDLPTGMDSEVYMGNESRVDRRSTTNAVSGTKQSANTGCMGNVFFRCLRCK